jgi:N-acetylglucosamine-6-phosphate deacetylase
MGKRIVPAILPRIGCISGAIPILFAAGKNCVTFAQNAKKLHFSIHLLANDGIRVQVNHSDCNSASGAQQ